MQFFALDEDGATKGWSAELRTEQRRQGSDSGGRWLRDERDLKINPNAQAVNPGLVNDELIQITPKLVIPDQVLE